ncbi:MAG: 50S ribosomal protein L11 methyltransferase [Flavobacteriales bacterium]|nr:50S ribosomal protein L11 methyltransferase [Flavobacteriales bacterium]
MNYIEITAIILPLEMGRDILIAELSEIGFESFIETENGIQAYIQAGMFSEKLLRQISILNHHEFKIDIKINEIEEQNWNEVWEHNFEPINVNNQCYIYAPFHNKKNEIEYNIEIEPKMSFGTGHHETTFLMISELLKMDLSKKKVLDMGCGTGVLAILTEMKNAENILAIDIDEWAYNNTIENVNRNNCKKIEVLKGEAELLNGKKFDVVIANINRNVLLKDMENYAKSLSPNGEILLSGFFMSDKEILLEETKKYNLQLISSNQKNDWILLHLKLD